MDVALPRESLFPKCSAALFLPVEQVLEGYPEQNQKPKPDKSYGHHVLIPGPFSSVPAMPSICGRRVGKKYRMEAGNLPLKGTSSCCTRLSSPPPLYPNNKTGQIRFRFLHSHPIENNQVGTIQCFTGGMRTWLNSISNGSHPTSYELHLHVLGNPLDWHLRPQSSAGGDQCKITMVIL